MYLNHKLTKMYLNNKVEKAIFRVDRTSKGIRYKYRILVSKKTQKFATSLEEARKIRDKQESDYNKQCDYYRSITECNLVREKIFSLKIGEFAAIKTFLTIRHVSSMLYVNKINKSYRCFQGKNVIYILKIK